MNFWIKHIIRFAGAMAIQVFILNSLQIKLFATVQGIPLFVPFYYLLFLLMLPVGLAKWQMMLLGFLCGMIMDMYSNTGGVHAGACVLLGFVRPNVLNLFLQSNVVKDPFKTTPSLNKMGFGAFVLYTTACLFIFNLYFYSVQIGLFKHFLVSLLMIILSTITTVALLLVSQLLFFDIKRRK